ncbi:hypothetical protein DNHGIG_26070 [Collibacillus ludicampi]|uniref:Uncharacterized protein n=1 Tax=Collibacillus ludicampi TaxID=2771369 RepID=A0AAV4LH67_9BACL|nr:hypothetical protein [Collibacillus ludicampi]GIM47058.1 hypothetical protein DNHGIG_26070 [Collibacillus ludicampi]
MPTYTIIKIKENMNLEKVVERIKERGCFEHTPDDPKWPKNEKLFAKWIPLEEEPMITKFETGIGTNEEVVQASVEIQRPRQVWTDSQKKLLPLEKRINITQTDVIFFENGGSCYVAVQGSARSQQVNRTKRDLLEPSELIDWEEGKRTESVGLPSEYRIDPDMFYWLYYLYLEKKGEIPSNPPMRILELSGYRGTSLEDTQYYKSRGDRVAKLLPTLAFLYGNDDLKSLRFTLNTNSEQIELELHHDGSFELVSYAGKYASVEANYKEAAQLLLVYKDIIPRLKDAYENDKDKRNWNENVRDQFNANIGRIIIERIKETLPSLEETGS